MAYVFGVQVLNKLDRITETIVGKTGQEERLRCARGDHQIGNEPYTFIAEGEHDDAGEPVCLRCLARSIQERIEELDEEKAKETEWNNFAEEERELRRAKAKANGVCPRCDKTLTLKGSCPMCCEYPFNINAPMNQVWRERERESLSGSEKHARSVAAVPSAKKDFVIENGKPVGGKKPPRRTRFRPMRLPWFVSVCSRLVLKVE